MMWRVKSAKRAALSLGLGLWLGLAGGCSGGSEDFVLAGGGTSTAGARVQGVLARSSTGAVALLDAPLPAGFTPLANTEVRVLNSETSVRTAADGSLSLTTSESRPRLQVKTEGGVRVIEVPAFASSAGSPVALQHFPPALRLAQGESAAMRVVGVDANGAYLPVSATQTLTALPDAVPIPHTTTLAAPPLLRTTGQEAAGHKAIQSVSGNLTQTGNASTYSAACQAILAGRVLNDGQPVEGAVVQVEGSTAAYTTGSDGQFLFEHLAPLPSAVHVYVDGKQVGLGFAPLTSQLMIRLEIPSRPTTYQAGAVLPVSNASGVAVRYSRDIFVTEGATLSEFTPDGGTVTLTPTPPTLQNAVGVAADFSGEAYVADRGAGALVPISAKAGPLALPSPIAVTVDSGANILALTEDGTGFAYLANQSSTAWSDPVPLATGQLSDPQAIAAGPDGRIFVADTGNDRIAVLEITENGRVLHGDPGGGTLKAQVVAHWAVSDPLGVAIGPNAEVYVATSSGVTVTDSRGHDPITVSSAPALGPIGIDREGVVWVAESGGVVSYKPSTPAVIAQRPPSPTGQSLITGADLNSMESQMLQVMQQYGFVGATLAISVNGRLVLSRGYGYAQRDSRAQTQTQPDMLFRLASCSKIFTGAAALLQLQDYEQDIASSDQPFAPGGLLAGGVTGYDLAADGFADSRTPDITLLNLLQMTAGLDTPGALYSPLARTLGGETPPATAVEILLHTFSNNVLRNAPGSTFVYSDVAYMTLGRWIEAVAQSQGLDETYATYVQTRLLAPLGITEMRIANTALNGAAPNEVRYYPYTGETCGQSVFTNSPEQVPATYGATYDGLSHDSTGGWIASATDLVVLANALAPEQTPPGFTNPLDAPRKALFKALPDFTGANRSKYYGAGGWFLSMNENGTVTSMNKDGGLPGTTTFVQYQRQGEDQVVFCYLLNGRAGPGAKRSSNARTLFQAPLDTFLASQAGKWPSGDLFP